MQSGKEAEKALQPWDEEKGSGERLQAHEKVETEDLEEGEDGDGDQELQFNGKNDDNESEFEFPSFMNNISTPSLPGFCTKSQSRALDNSWDNNHDLGDVPGELDEKDYGQESGENDEDQQGHGVLVSYPDASRSPEHSFTTALFRSVQAEG